VCTSGEKDAGILITELSAGELKQVPTMKRNTVRPDDVAGMDALRKTCPARHDADAIDMDTAIRLLNRPTLFADAIRLAQPPIQSASDNSFKDDYTILP
jgi:carboxyl-terminal processing protease